MEDIAPRPSRMLRVNTIIVLSLTIALLAFSACVAATILVCTAVTSNPHYLVAFLGYVAFAAISLAFGIPVFLSVFRRSPKATRVATGFYFMGAALAANLAIAGVIAAFFEGSGVLLAVVVLVGVSTYAGFCGVLSSRWGRHLAQRAANPGVEADRDA
jgi:hypothetical protein